MRFLGPVYLDTDCRCLLYTKNNNCCINLLKIFKEKRGSQDFNVKILHLQTIKKFETLKAAAFKSMVLQS